MGIDCLIFCCCFFFGQYLTCFSLNIYLCIFSYEFCFDSYYYLLFFFSRILYASREKSDQTVGIHGSI